MSKQVKIQKGYWITPTQKRNLEILAEGLLTVVEEEFDMATFYNPKGQREFYQAISSASAAKYHCGTAACAVGHGPLFGIKPRDGEDWHEYAARVFGVGEARFPHAYTDNEALHSKAEAAFEWMFGGHWKDTDDTPRGASARIKHFLTYGIPRDWEAQQEGRAPLIYTVQRTMEVPNGL